MASYPREDGCAPDHRAGRMLAEVAIATGVGAVAILGILAIVVAAGRLDRSTRELALARRAADARLAELAALDAPTFRAVLAGGLDSLILRVDVPGLTPARAGDPVGRVVLDPPPGDAAFDGATLFRARVVLEWRSETGPVALELEALIRPGAGGEGASP